MMILPVVQRSLASDDSNSGQLTSLTQLDPQQLANSLNLLNQNVNDTYIKSLISQLASEINNGNYEEANCSTNNTSSFGNSFYCRNGVTLSLIQNYVNTNPNSVPGSLYALLNSLVYSNGQFYLNQQMLARLLGLSNLNNNGIPSGLSNESPEQASIDLQTLSSLLSNVNPDLMAQLLNDAAGIQFSGNQTPNAQFKLNPPPVNNIAAPIKTEISLSSYIYYLPILVFCALIFFIRKKISSFLGNQRLPEDEDYDTFNLDFKPRNNREKIIMIFRKSVFLVGVKGIKKMKFETHREFTQRLSNTQFYRDFRNIAELYEKAKFTLFEVGDQEVFFAEESYSKLEST